MTVSNTTGKWRQEEGDDGHCREDRRQGGMGYMQLLFYWPQKDTEGIGNSKDDESRQERCEDYYPPLDRIYSGSVFKSHIST